MFKTKEYNNLPETVLSKYILKDGEVAVFQLEEHVKKPVNGELTWPVQYPIPASSVYFDDDGVAYPIAPIDSSGSLVPPTVRSFKGALNGRIVLVGGTMEASILYPYLMLLPGRKGGHERKNVKTFFYLVDENKMAQKTVEENKSKADLIKRLVDLSDGKKVELAIAIGAQIDIGQSVKEKATSAMAYLTELALSAPDRLKQFIEDKNTKYLALARVAKEAKIVYYDPSEKVLRWADNGDVLMKVRTEWISDFAERLKENVELFNKIVSMTKTMKK